MITLSDACKGIVNSIKRKAGNWGVGEVAPSESKIVGGAKFFLVAGAPHAIQVDGGVIVALGMTKDSLRELRDACDHYINDH